MRGNSTLARVEERGSKLKVWKTKPISRLRMSASSSSDILETSLAVKRYLPVVGVSRQPSMFIMVDLPLPDGPMTARYSFRRTLSETPRKAWTTSSPILYSLVTPSISMTTAPGSR